MTLPERANRRILFVDLNSFFTSCEQADNPTLIGRPVIVVATKGSCALAASYEAKAYGIRTGTSEREARFLCPGLVVLPARPKRYMEFHYRFEEILNNLAPHVTMRSVDEASVRLCRNEDPILLGKAIKQRLWDELGEAINCSVGIGPNIFLAKLGTELQKPDGLVEIKLEDLPHIYQKVGLRDLCGINFAMERQLHQAGIFSVTDFYQTGAERLRELFGVIGYRWWLQLHGYVSYEASRERKSLSHSHVLPPHLRQPLQAYATLQHLIAKVGRRLRREGVAASSLNLSVHFADQTRENRHLRITPAADTLTLKDHIGRLWKDIDPRQSVLKLSIWTTDLKPLRGLPEPLFEAERRRLRLANALDRINDRYGTKAIHFAVTDTKSSRAPDRIAFSSLFKIEHE